MTSYNKVCLVTGGTGGIGASISRRMSACGFHVIATCRIKSEAEILALKNELFPENDNIDILPVDVSSYESCSSLINKVTQKSGVISVLINNAGITADSSFKKMSLDQWQSVVSCNLDSMFNMSKLVFSPMCVQGWGRIINISSINAQKGQFGQANYAASKAGILGFTKSLAAEGASSGVTVNSVSPGYIATRMVMKLPDDIKEYIVSGIPVGRFGRPDEIAHTIKFIVDENSGFLTGSNIAVNGGQHMF